MAGRVARLLKILGIVVGSIIGLLIVLSVVNLTMTAVERNHVRAPGHLVSVNGHRIHVLTVGVGRPNVVLLSGHGNPAPVSDFAPLIEALQHDFSVTVVEYPGYGWSDGTKEARTNANIVGELRAALREAGVLPPYVLVPHSMSGLYTLYYASKYPADVLAVIGLDTTVPAQGDYYDSLRLPLLPSFLRVTGLLRLAVTLDPGLAGHAAAPYTDTERETMRRMIVWNYGNATMNREFRSVARNCADLNGVLFPNTIPVSFVLSEETAEQGPKVIPGFDWIKAHQTLLAPGGKARITLVPGGHFVYWSNSQQIAAVVRETIQAVSHGLSRQ